MEQTFKISWESIFKFFVLIVAFYVFYIIRNILIWFVFALAIAVLFDYLIDFFEKKKIPRLIGCLILYFLIFAGLSFFIYKTAPILIDEIEDFFSNLPQYLARISPFFERFGIEIFRNNQVFLETLKTNLAKGSQNLFAAFSSIFGGISSAIFIFFLAFFISLEKNFGEKVIIFFSPERYKSYLINLWVKTKEKVGGWFISRIIGAIFVGVLTFFVLNIFNVKYSFILSIFAGVLDFIPFVGPIIAGIIISLIAVLNSLLQGAFVFIAFVIIQVLENSLVLPLLSKKFVGISPVLVLVAIAVGGKLWGVLGAILAIPLAGILFEFIRDFLKKKKEKYDSSVEENKFSS